MADEKMRLIRMRAGNRARFQRRGIHEKQRLDGRVAQAEGDSQQAPEADKSERPSPRPGYGSPAAVRGLHPCGLSDMLVHNEGMLAALDPKVHAVRIAAGVGMKKKVEIQKKALEAGLRVLNPRRAPVSEEETVEEAGEEPDEVNGDE